MDHMKSNLQESLHLLVGLSRLFDLIGCAGALLAQHTLWHMSLASSETMLRDHSQLKGGSVGGPALENIVSEQIELSASFIFTLLKQVVDLDFQVHFLDIMGTRTWQNLMESSLQVCFLIHRVDES